MRWLLMRWFGICLWWPEGEADALVWICLWGLEVKRAGADAADALVWICLWPGGEAGRG